MEDFSIKWRLVGSAIIELLLLGAILTLGHLSNNDLIAIAYVCWVEFGKLGRWLSRSVLHDWPLAPAMTFALAWSVALAFGLHGLVLKFDASGDAAALAMGGIGIGTISYCPVHERRWPVKVVPVLASIGVSAWLTFG